MPSRNAQQTTVSAGCVQLGQSTPPKKKEEEKSRPFLSNCLRAATTNEAVPLKLPLTSHNQWSNRASIVADLSSPLSSIQGKCVWTMTGYDATNGRNLNKKTEVVFEQLSSKPLVG